MIRHAMRWLLVGLVVLMLGALAPVSQVFAADQAASALAALTWLRTRQQDDGSFPGLDAGASIDAIFAFAAAGVDPNSVLKNGHSPVSYLGDQVGSYAAKSVGAAAKSALGAIAAGKDPRSFGGHDLLTLVEKGYNPQTGRYGVQTTDHVYALMALSAAKRAIPQPAIDALLKLQLADGGWSFDGVAATGSDTNTTALAAQALAAAGYNGPAYGAINRYFASQRNADGGYPYSKASQFGADTDANSTALSTQALTTLASVAGGDPNATAAAITALVALQNQNGAFRYQAALPDDNDLATAQAIPALLAKPFPIVSGDYPASGVPASLPTTGGAEPTGLIVVAIGLLLAGALFVARASRARASV